MLKCKNLKWLILKVLVLSSFFSFSDLFAQSSSLTPIGKQTRSGNPLGYYEYLPANYNSRDDWPVFVVLHGLGRGGDGSQSSVTSKLSNWGIVNWLKNNDVPFVVLVPQDNDGSFSGNPLRVNSYYGWARGEYADKTTEFNWSVSYNSGSGAAFKNWSTANTANFQSVAAHVPSAAVTGGGTDAQENAVANSGASVWFHHSLADNTIAYQPTRNFFRGLIAKVGTTDLDKYRYTLYNNVGHGTFNSVVFNNNGRNQPQQSGDMGGGGGDYYEWRTDSFWDWLQQQNKNPVTDNTPPVLSNATAVSDGSLSGSGSVTTDESGGTLFWVATTSSNTPSVNQIKAGQNHVGATAVSEGSQSVGASGIQNVDVAGLQASTAYFLHYIHTDLARNNSNRISSGSFTTDDLDNYTQVINAVSVGIPDFTWTLNGTISELNDHPTTSSGSIGYAANIVPGIAGQSWQSNGAAHINPENSDLINSDPSTVSRSVSLWFESTNPVGWQNIYEEGGSTHGWHIGLYDDYLTLSITQNSSVRNSIQFQIAANTVYHVAATFDLADQSSGDNMHLYVNGAEVGASNFTTQNFLNSHTGDIQFGEISDGIALGSDQGSKTKVNFAGRIQRIDYWSEEELSAQDVEDIYILGGDVTLTAPTDIELNNNSVEEGTASGTKIGDLTADGTVPITFSLVSGSGDADNGKFSIVNRELRISEVPNFSTQSSYSVRISAENAAGSVSEVFTIGVTEAVINSPTSLLLSNLIVLDETTAGASIGTFTTDGDEPVYTLVTGAGDEDNSAFSINADELVISETVDFSTQSSYSIRARVSNSEGAFERAFTLEVVIVPSEINLSTTDIEDETSEDDVVSTLSTNGSGAITFALTGGSGSDDNNSFTVSGNQLIVEEFVDFSVKSSYRIRLSATNDGGTYAEAFQLNVLEPRFAPDNLELNSSIILDGLAAGSEITTISADGTDPLVFSLASGAGDTNNASFSVISNQLFIEENVDIDIKNTFSIRLEASNSEGSTESAFTLDVVRAPSTLTLSNDEIEDGTASGSLVAILNSDGSAPISYSLIGGAGSGDNSAFSISGNQLIIQETVNFASKSSYSIQLRVANVGGILDRNFVLNVFEPLASPTDLDLSTSTLLDGTVSNSEIATISARGTAPIEFTLVAGAGDQDNASFSINEDQLSILETADFIAKPSYSIRIAATNDLGSIEDSFTLTVLGEKVTLTVTANNMSSNYGREVPPLTFGYRGFIDGDGPSALDAEPAASTNATLQSTPGDYTISISGGASEKYDFEYVSGILDVQKAALNVSVQDVEIEQGESIPSFLLSYEGFRNEETATDLPSQPQASTSANSSSSPGNYPILLTGGSSNNYSFVYEEGTLTILEACALDISLTFDELDSIINVNISGGVAPYNISWNTGATSESIKIDRFGPYSVTVEDARSCDAETTLFITQNSFNVLGLEDASRLEFWPNPTTAMLHLKSDKVIGRVQIFSLAGQLVFQKEINSKTQTLNIGEIKSGTYLLTLNNDFDGVTRILLKN